MVDGILWQGIDLCGSHPQNKNFSLKIARKMGVVVGQFGSRALSNHSISHWIQGGGLVIAAAIVMFLWAKSKSSIVVPERSNVTTVFGQAPREQQLPARISVLVWNVEKGKELDFSSDFSRLQNGKHLILLQEFVSSPLVLAVAGDFQYHVATAFHYLSSNGTIIIAGPATGSVAPAESSYAGGVCFLFLCVLKFFV